MALAGDFMYASKNAVFGLPEEVKLGAYQALEELNALKELLGRNLSELILQEKFNGDDAAKVEVNEVFGDKEAMIEAAKKPLNVISKNSLHAVGKSKEAILRGADGSLMEGLKLEALIFSEIFDSHDAKEGTLAFYGKRTNQVLNYQSLQVNMDINKEYEEIREMAQGLLIVVATFQPIRSIKIKKFLKS